MNPLMDTLAQDARRLIDAISPQSTGLREDVERLRRSLDAFETGRAAGPQVSIEISASIVRDADDDPCIFSANVCDAVLAGMSEVDIIAALAGQAAPAPLSPIINGVYEQAKALDELHFLLQHGRTASDFSARLDGWIAANAVRIGQAPTEPVRDALETLREASRALWADRPDLARKLDALIVQTPGHGVRVRQAHATTAAPAIDAVDLARGAGIEIDNDPDQWGLWIWRDGSSRCEVSLDTMEEAALDALDHRFKADWLSQLARGETSRTFLEFCAWQLADPEPEPESMRP